MKIALYSCPILINLGFSRQIFEKFPIIKFHENPSSGSRGLHADRQTDTRTDMTKLVVAFRNFGKGPNKYRWTKYIFLKNCFVLYCVP